MPEHIVGIHLMPPLAPPDPATLGELTDSERHALDAIAAGAAERIRLLDDAPHTPQTIGYALTDSPAGLAAWISEKLMSWTDPRSELSPDAILDNLMFYWLPRTAASSARLYWESLHDVTRWLEGPLEPARPRRHARRLHACFPTSYNAPRGAGPSSASTTSATGTSPTAAATSPPWSSRHCSSTR